MFCRSITLFTCIFVAVATAINYSDPHSTTESNPEVIIYLLRTHSPESSTVEPVQEVTQTTATDLAALLDAGDGAVVILVAGETRLAAHRDVLASRSPVFAAMLRNGTLENSSRQIAFPEVEGPVLRQLLAFLYTLQASQLPSMAPQLLAAADRYGVSVLKAACEQQVAAQLSVETAMAAAVLAVKHSSNSLRMAAVNFIREHLVQVMATPGWADAIHTEPEYVVQVTRLLIQPPVETRTTANEDSRTSRSTQPPSDHSEDGGSDVTAASTTTIHSTPTPDDTNTSRIRFILGTQSHPSEMVHLTAHTLELLCLKRLQEDKIYWEQCFEWNLTAEEKDRRLGVVAGDGSVAELQALLAVGADVAAVDKDGWTPLHHAASWGSLEAVRYLLSRGAAIDARDSLQLTPLYWAAYYGNAAVVRLLAASGADPNARDQSGWTALHSAADFGWVEVATALLEAGAKRRAKDNQGRTPLDIARRQNYQQLIDMLR